MQRPGNLRGMRTFAGTGIRDRGFGVMGKGVFAPPPGPRPAAVAVASQNSRIRKIQSQADGIQARIGSISSKYQVKAAQSRVDYLLRRINSTKVGAAEEMDKADAKAFVENIKEQLAILAGAPERLIPAAAAAAGAAAATTTAAGGAALPAKAVLQADQAAAVRELTRMVPATTAEAQVEVKGSGGHTRKELLTSPGQRKFTRTTTKVGAGKVKTDFERLMKDVPADFDEAKYIAKHPDVAKAVRQGAMPSGLWHYVMYGKKEGRGLSGWFGDFGGVLGSNTILMVVAAAGACWYLCRKK